VSPAFAEDHLKVSGLLVPLVAVLEAEFSDTFHEQSNAKVVKPLLSASRGSAIILVLPHVLFVKAHSKAH
jgi:hypothetical protein